MRLYVGVISLGDNLAIATKVTKANYFDPVFLLLGNHSQTYIIHIFRT